MTGHWVFHHYEYSIGMVNVQSDGEAKLRRQILLDVYPILARVEALIDSTMVLLVQHIRLRRVLDQPVNALPKFWILVRHEISPRILIGKDPAFPTIICTHTADSRDSYPHARCI